MITAADVKARFPALSGFGDSFIEALILEAALTVKETGWGSLYDTGMLHLVAHLVTSTPTAPGGGGVSGPVSSRRVGEVSVSYAPLAPALSSSAYSSTSYGVRFLELQRLAQGGPVTATCTDVSEVTVG